MANQVGRSAAGASRFVSSKVDWNRLFKLSGSNTNTLSAIQAKWSQAAMKYERLNQYELFFIAIEISFSRMNSFPDSLPKIDFSYYRRLVSDPSLVDKLQKEVKIQFITILDSNHHSIFSMKMPRSVFQKIRQIVSMNLMNMLKRR